MKLEELSLHNTGLCPWKLEPIRRHK